MPTGCPLCAGTEVELLFRKQEIPYHRCRSCQFVFSVPEQNPNLANNLEDYEAAYIQYLEEGPEDRANHKALLEWMRQSNEIDGRRLLDVGCGSGKFVRFLRAQGFEAFGTEPSHALYERYLQKDTCFYPSTVDQLLADPTVGRFGVITACDVLEHVEQPFEFLAAMAELLETGGVLFISTPDLGSPHARLFGQHWHFLYRYHLSYFTKATLVKTAERLGLTLTAFARRGRIRSVGYILRYGLEFIFAGKGGWVPHCLDRISFPTNLFDTMYLTFRKDS